MASKACTSWKARSYQGGWYDWNSNFDSKKSDGYCWVSGESYAHCLSFKTPDVSNFYKSSSLSITIPIIRTSSKFSKSGTLYFKLLSSDPTGGSVNTNLKPSASSNDVAKSWSSDDQNVHKLTFKISSDALLPDKTYYLTIGGSKLLGIGYVGYTPSEGYYSAELEYSTWTAAEKGTTTITDNYNNTFTITATVGEEGSNNPAKLTDLKWGYSTSYGKTYENGKAIAIDLSGTKDRTKAVYASSTTNATYGSDPVATASKSIRRYFAPNKPGKPTIYHEKNNLTLKEDIVYKWTAATPAVGSDGNTYSPVIGYRIRLYQLKAGTTEWKNIPIRDVSGTQKSELKNSEYIYDREVENPTTISLRHTVHGFEAGDKVKLSIQAYSRYGKENTGDNSKLLSEVVTSAETTVQNSAVMHAKVGNTWQEGQVHVKVGNTWVEAQSVYVKVGNAWVEAK